MGVTKQRTATNDYITREQLRKTLTHVIQQQYWKAIDAYRNYEEANKRYSIAKGQFEATTTLRPDPHDNTATFLYIQEKNRPGRASEVLGFWYNKVNHWAQDIQVRHQMIEIAKTRLALLGEE